MALVKATDYGAVRKLAVKRGKDFEESFVAALSPEHAKAYRQVMVFDWLAVEEHARFLTEAASLLYPNHPLQLLQLGRDMAELTFSGVYRVFLRIPTIPFLISRAATMYKTFYDTGEATAECLQPGRADLEVRGFPEKPQALRITTTGHVQVLLERTGTKGVRVTHRDGDPQCWRWSAHWP